LRSKVFTPISAHGRRFARMNKARATAALAILGACAFALAGLLGGSVLDFGASAALSALAIAQQRKLQRK
jgi:hypothetical protein